MYSNDFGYTLTFPLPHHEVNIVFSEMSQHVLDGLSGNLIHTFISPLRVNCITFGASLTFDLVPSSSHNSNGPILWFITEHLQNK